MDDNIYLPIPFAVETGVGRKRNTLSIDLWHVVYLVLGVEESVI